MGEKRQNFPMEEFQIAHVALSAPGKEFVSPPMEQGWLGNPVLMNRAWKGERANLHEETWQTPRDPSHHGQDPQRSATLTPHTR